MFHLNKNTYPNWSIILQGDVKAEYVLFYHSQVAYIDKMHSFAKHLLSMLANTLLQKAILCKAAADKRHRVQLLLTANFML